MSAPFRYARILNGLSSLISRRSAVSRRMRAIAWLSKPQTFSLDAEVQKTRPAGGERFGDRLSCRRGAVAKETAASSGAANFRPSGARGGGASDEVLDGSRGDAGCQPLPVVPFDGDLSADFVPIATQQRAAHRYRGVADPLEAVEDVPVTVDVALSDLPVVGARVSWRAGVGEHDPALELGYVDVHSDAPDPLHAELDRRDAAVQRRPIVLNAGRHADRLALHVHRDLQQRVGIAGLTGKPGQRATHRDRQCRGAGDTGARR